jgi:hypothetical protein
VKFVTITDLSSLDCSPLFTLIDCLVGEGEGFFVFFPDVHREKTLAVKTTDFRLLTPQREDSKKPKQ